jgi:hypothetical protein
VYSAETTGIPSSLSSDWLQEPWNKGSALMPQPKVTLKIPKPLYDHIKGLIDGSGFNSVTDFVVFVLRDIVYEGRREESKELTPHELQRIKQKLKDLGYL